MAQWRVQLELRFSDFSVIILYSYTPQGYEVISIQLALAYSTFGYFAIILIRAHVRAIEHVIES